MYLGKNALIDNENTDGFLQTHCLNKNHQDEILSLEWSPCGRYIISAAKDNEIKLWDFSGPLWVDIKGFGLTAQHTKRLMWGVLTSLEGV